jgi:hypothetical protein
MQIGADVFCDTQIIIRELERRFPSPTLFPPGAAGVPWALIIAAEARPGTVAESDPDDPNGRQVGNGSRSPTTMGRSSSAARSCRFRRSTSRYAASMSAAR